MHFIIWLVITIGAVIIAASMFLVSVCDFEKRDGAINIVIGVILVFLGLAANRWYDARPSVIAERKAEQIADEQRFRANQLASLSKPVSLENLAGLPEGVVVLEPIKISQTGLVQVVAEDKDGRMVAALAPESMVIKKGDVVKILLMRYRSHMLGMGAEMVMTMVSK